MLTLKKLLKYDIKSVSKLWWIGALTSVGASILGAFLIRFFVAVAESDSDSILLNLISTLALVAGIFCVIAIAISFVFTMILVFVRFYKHFFTDEGYLTFTLPVKRSTHLFSKTLNAAIWLSAHSVLTVLSYVLLVLFAVPPEEGHFLNLVVFEEIGKLFASAWSSVGAWLIVWILEALIIAFVGLMFSIFLIHFCITFGSVIVRKAKIIVSIAIYYAFTSALSMAVQIGAFLFNSFMLRGMSVLIAEATKNQACAIYSLLILTIIAAFAAVSTLLYSATQYLLDRKLNLA